MRNLIQSFSLVTCLLTLALLAHAQTPTVGVITADYDMAPGYALFAPNSTSDTYLIDNCGRLVHSWTNSPFAPGSSVYLLEDGSLLRTCRILNPNFILGGQGGRIERWSWNDSLMWSYDFSASTYTQHHDVEPLPNGNFLLLGVESKKGLEPALAGRNPMLISNNTVWSDFVVEIKPIGPDSGETVWEWHAWDHLVQDYDSMASNFGVVADHPELIDLNYIGGFVAEDWLHSNGVAYSEPLDQIAISIANFNEMWLIDHSTTTAEAAGHNGGQRSKGGDLLYRWGNPITYQAGTLADQKFFFQHNVHWIPDGYPNEGKLLIFNNGVGRNWSSAEVLSPPQLASGDYSLVSGQAYGPLMSDLTVNTDSMTDFFTRVMGGVQAQPNGNFLFANAGGGYSIEINPAGDIVWKYRNPISNMGTTIQGSYPPPSTNTFFRMERYAPDFVGFAGKTLSPGMPLEVGSDLTNCIEILTGSPAPTASTNVQLFPNPVALTLHLSYSANKPMPYRIFDLQGAIKAKGMLPRDQSIDMSTWPAGLYFFQIGQETPQKLIKISN